jgi:hypothetical protein
VSRIRLSMATAQRAPPVQLVNAKRSPRNGIDSRAPATIPNPRYWPRRTRVNCSTSALGIILSSKYRACAFRPRRGALTKIATKGPMMGMKCRSTVTVSRTNHVGNTRVSGRCLSKTLTRVWGGGTGVGLLCFPATTMSSSPSRDMICVSGYQGW